MYILFSSERLRRGVAYVMVASLVSFFIHPSISPARAISTSVVINEVLVAGATTTDEFIELYNLSTVPVSLTGWRLTKRTATGTQTNLLSSFPDVTLAPNDHFLIAHPTGYAGAMPPDVSYSTAESLAANNSVVLADSSGVIVDLVGWGTAGTFETAPAAGPGTGESIERAKINEQITDTDNNLVDFIINEIPTPTHASGVPDPIPNPVPDPDPTPTPLPSNVVINEFLPDPVDSDEWIELKLNATSDLDITDWNLRDGGGRLLPITASLTTTSPYTVISVASGYLNNGGDHLDLLSADGTVIDAVTYGAWDDGDDTDNAVTAADGASVARIPDGADTNIDKNDFATATTPTPNVANPTPTPDPTPDPVPDPTPDPDPLPTYLPGDIVINEFLPDPNDSDEWIELKLVRAEGIDLTDWQLRDGGGRTLTSTATLTHLSPYIILSVASGLLNNGGDHLDLLAPDGSVVDSVSYGTWNDANILDNAPTATDGASIARMPDGADSNVDKNDFVVATTPTPNSANTAPIPDPTPDPDPAPTPNPNPQPTPTTLKFSEFFPNPKGSDATEYLELVNTGTVAISLVGWKLESSDDEVTLSANDADQLIQPGAYRSLYRTQSHLSLVNGGGQTIILLSPDDVEIDRVTIPEKPKEGEAYAQIGSAWNWTSTSTPNAANILTRPNTQPKLILDGPHAGKIDDPLLFSAEDSTDSDNDSLVIHWTWNDGVTAAGETTERTFTSGGKYEVTVTADDGHGGTDTKIFKVEIVPKAKGAKRP